VGLGWRAAGAFAGLLVLMILVAALATGGRAGAVTRFGGRVVVGGANLIRGAQDLVDGQFADLGFHVDAVNLRGASKVSRDEILEAASIEPGAPILGLDLAAIRGRVERVGWVERANVMRLLPGTLVISVTERPLMAIWEHQGRRDVVARGGMVVTAVDPSQFRRLPTIVGEGANMAAESFLPLVLNRPRLAARLRAIRRVDGLRWDLFLTNGALVLLPAEGETRALDTLDALDRTNRILDLDLERIDLRTAGFTVVRPRIRPLADTQTKGA
jgi:cell division protein FtsQ